MLHYVAVCLCSCSWRAALLAACACTAYPRKPSHHDFNRYVLKLCFLSALSTSVCNPDQQCKSSAPPTDALRDARKPARHWQRALRASQIGRNCGLCLTLQLHPQVSFGVSFCTIARKLTSHLQSESHCGTTLRKWTSFTHSAGSSLLPVGLKL